MKYILTIFVLLWALIPSYLAAKAVTGVTVSAVGGAAYLVSQAIKDAKVVGFDDLGMEAIYEFDVVDMPVTVAVDTQGTSVHQIGPQEWYAKINAKEVG